jgi:glyoxylase-like metal-dependent hydrolase (beta-lactamase superfamily II)
MMRKWRIVAVLLAVLCFGYIGTAVAQNYEVYDIMYSRLEGYPVDAILFGTDRGKTMMVPFMYTYIKGGGREIVFDTGYTDVALGMKWGAPSGAWTSVRDNLRVLGTRPDRIDMVFVGHMHWDHGGGLNEFPKAKFVIQKREIEFAAGEITMKKHTMAGFDPKDILALVKLNWEGRVQIVDGDVENVAPGINVYLTPGHTAGTLSISVPTRKGKVVCTGDAVYTNRNLDEDIPLGFGYNLVQMLDSFAKIREVLGDDGTLVGGHDPGILDRFPKIADNIVRVD